MDQNQQDQPAMSSSDELAKTLSGGLQFEESPIGGSTSTPPADDKTADSATADDTSGPFSSDDSSDLTPPSLSSMPEPEDKSDEPAADEDKPAVQDDQPSGADTELDRLKSSALDDLRPLVGKLNLSPEEKFDTLLLIIRSTDDQNLLEQAHAAAKEISDDTKRAQALLDIIKEVDYFNAKK